jgi:hypothetical protein
MQIRYSVVKDCEVVVGTWEGAFDAALAKGRAAVHANPVAYTRDLYTYRADEVGSYWEVKARDLAELGAALLDGHDLSEAYSIWCTANGVEVL